MKKFWRITYVLYRNAFIRDAQISISAITGMVNSLFDGSVSVAIILLVYTKTSQIGGWNVWETLILISSINIITIIVNSWTKKGTSSFAESMVRMGDYDFYLIKPFDPMISISISKPRIYNLIKIPFFLSLLFYAAFHLGRPIPLINIALFILMVICAGLLFYSIRIITVTPAFWITKSWSLTTITDRIQTVIKYPATIYPRILSVMLMTIFPVLAISYLPVKILLFEPKLSYIIYMIFITAFFLWLARSFWKFGEKFYGSASS